MTDPNIGFGQQTPDDSTSDYNVVAFIINQFLGRVRTATLVQVKAVTNEGGVSPVGFIDAQPLVNQIDGVGATTPHGTIFNLPYFRLQGGTNAIILDPKVGDIGIAIIADRDISAVKTTKAVASPGSFRKFDLADGVYIGGVLNGTPDQYIGFTDDGIKLADKNGNVIQMKPGSIAITGNVTVTGSFFAGFGGADQVGLQSHRHLLNNTPPIPGT